MAMTPLHHHQQQHQQQERSKTLHNFSLPCLKWGHQRVLRCVKVTDDYHHHHHHHQQHLLRSSSGDQFQSKPDSFVPHKQNPVHQIPNNTTKRLKVSAFLEAANEDSSKPWNLRTRRAACKAPLVRIDNKSNGLESPKRNLEIDSSRRCDSGLYVKRLSSENVEERVKFSVSLAKGEIEEDFMDMARMRPPRRPKKRPRTVQKYLDSIFPGLWLTEVTPDAYKVAEVPES